MRLRNRRPEGGAVAVFAAIMAVVLLSASALAVDLGHTWAARGQLQVQADRAATYAAEFLPADTPAQQAKVSKAVAYYLACHEVPGQRELDPTIPVCPADPDSSTLDAYASRLLSAGMVTVPVRNQVQVKTPRARVDYGFAKVMGADKSIQEKVATAKVTSPGLLAPMALSLDCLLNTGSNLLGGAGLPFGYVSTTHHNAGYTPGTTTWGGTTRVDPQLNGIVPGRLTQQLAGPAPSVQVSGSKWPTLAANQGFVVVFAKGEGIFRQQYEQAGTVVLDAGANPRRLGYIQVSVPFGVTATTGTWEVKIVIETSSILGGTRVYSADTSYLEIDPLISSPNDVSCGRLLRSPRGGTQANVNFIRNLQEGIDHLISQYPSLLTTGSLALDALRNLVNLTQCGPGSVKDTNGLPPNQTPSCVVTNMSNAYEAGFTEGLIGVDGRLTCTSARPCRPGRSFQLNGRSINNDRFTDFVENTSLLTPSTFFNADSYLLTGLPVVTPTSNLSRDIYSSHRFMWVAVISTAGAASEVQAGDYPVLTFRPIFVTQASALDGSLPLIDTTALSPLIGGLLGAINLVDAAMTSLLTPYDDEEGLLMNEDGTVRAIRFLTISPDALPAVPVDYSGAESEYLGAGPRIIRLVR